MLCLSSKKILFFALFVAQICFFPKLVFAEPIADSGFLPKGMGTVGQPCRVDGSCVQGARCFEQQKGGSICLFPGSSSAVSSGSCPSGRVFLQCSDGGGCRLICTKIQGSGCDIGRTTFSFSALWWILLVFALVFGRLKNDSSE